MSGVRQNLEFNDGKEESTWQLQRRQQRKCQGAYFSTFATQQFLGDLHRAESYHEAEAENVRRYRELRKDLVARSVHVVCVRDLREVQNIDALHNWMEQKGAVEELSVVQTKGKYPAARVRFRSVATANFLVAGGGSHRCPVGCANGIIRIRHSHNHSSIVEAALRDSTIKLSATSLAVGHWCPRELDSFASWQEPATVGTADRTAADIWMEEKRHPGSFGIEVQLSERIVKITYESETATLRFKHIEGNLEICDENGSSSLIVLATRTPQVRNVSPLNDILAALFRNRHDDGTRAASFAHLGTNFSTCLAFKLQVSVAQLDLLFLSAKRDELCSYGILASETSSFQDARLIETELIGSPTPAFARCMEALQRTKPLFGIMIRSLLDKCCFSWFDLMKDRTEPGGVKNMIDVVNDCEEALATIVLQKLLDGCKKTRYPCQLFRRILALETDPFTTAPALASNCFAIPRVFLTPTKVLVIGVDQEESNRVVRRFVHEAGFLSLDFLRLRVCEEGGERLYHLDASLIEQWTQQILRGIEINGHRYHFLAYSSSQLKEASVWMVRPVQGWTVQKIRESLGDLSEMTASKVAARIGQCFSTTVPTLKSAAAGVTRNSNFDAHTDTPLHTVVLDIASAHSQLEHSDGTGIIKPESLQALLRHIPYADPHASIIQVRYGGAKGTLTAFKHSELKLSTRNQVPDVVDLVLRPSMIKFPAKFEDLEVCRVGSRVPYYLNRNVILILSSHGIRADVFVAMQREALSSLDRMMTDSFCAQRIVPLLGGPANFQRVTLLNMLDAGLIPTHDPFLFSCLLAVRAHALQDLRKKARIFVANGAVLMGGIDETGLLEDGCVFLQVAPPGTSLYHPVVGDVMVTKHPVLHSGDTRMLKAVDVPQLRHLRNVIVFSQRGSRPEANKMAGSDLDGDEYAVTWDKRLFFRRNVRPHDFDEQSTEKGKLLPVDNAEVMSRGLLDHFFRFAQNDSLGSISMLWQDYAALNGANCDECVQLAALHSIAVDFAKSGKPAIIPKELRWGDKPYAHWREKKVKNAYHDRGVIGQLYDAAMGRGRRDISENCQAAICGRNWTRHGQVFSRVPTHHNCYRSFLAGVYDSDLPSRLGVSPKSVALLGIASTESRSYEDEVARLMKRFHLRSEGELFTGCIRKFDSANKKRQNEIAEDLKRQCHQIRLEYRERFFSIVYDQVLDVYFPDDETSELGLDAEAASDDRYYDAREEVEFFNAEEGISDLDQGEEQENAAADDDDEEDEDTKRILKNIEHLSTTSGLPLFAHSEVWESLVPETARQLAAAYYVVTYSPDWREPKPNEVLLFSFPWIVDDVFAAAAKLEK